MVWFHTKCVPGEATDGIWTCHKCRRMPSQMVEMTEAMNHMATELQKLTKFCNNADLKYREEVNGLKNTNTLLTAENSKLVSELDKLKKEMKNQGERLPSSPRRNLLIGGSLLRRVATKKLVETDVKSVGNSLIVDATRTISNVTDYLLGLTWSCSVTSNWQLGHHEVSTVVSSLHHPCNVLCERPLNLFN